ncbi:MAG: hypothetical protein RLZZ374_1366 [Cyanobacteriota bacterium]
MSTSGVSTSGVSNPGASILLLSNGHGEDLSGALIATELRARGYRADALPLVGHGRAYDQAGIPLLGRTREYSTGGLGYTSLWGRLTEVFQGQVGYLLRRLALLFRIARRYDLVVVVGDVLPVAAAWLSWRPVVTYLVAYSSHYEGRLSLPWPSGACLASARFRRVLSRDALTASDLSEQLGRPLEFLGNPFFDAAVAASEPLATGQLVPAQRLGLLPGSRLPEALHNLELMLAVLAQLPEHLQQPDQLGLSAALVGGLGPEEVAPLASRLGWRLDSEAGTITRLRRGPLRLELVWGRFAAVLQHSDLVLSMTGTAAEQAVGLGKPVLQLVGSGPQFTDNFAEAQRRLLGPSLFCAEGRSGSAEQREGTARLLAQLLGELQGDGALAERCQRNGLERIGAGGGTARIADAIVATLGQAAPGGAHG